MKRIFLVLGILVVVGFLNSGLVRAEEAANQGSAATESPSTQASKAVDIGNKICPVSGDEIKEDSKVTYEYEGKVYNFCCAGCIEPFKKNPQEYINKVSDELNAKVKEVKPEMPSTMHDNH